ncbi:MAG: nickel pincer cofactor biosynthesis protein LarC [bacterium]
MKIAYFDSPSGLSGNMIIGALLDAGLDKGYLINALGNLRLNVPACRQARSVSSSSFGNREVHSLVSKSHYNLVIHKTQKHNITGTYFNVDIKGSNHHRGLTDILKIIKQSRLSKNVKLLSSKIFQRLAEAEAAVHGVPINKIHFHEVGAVDAIIDIVGACIGLEKLGIEKIYCSPLPNGKGKIIHAHGLLPNPSPATAYLLKGVPIYGTGIKGELVTPTGAAIITTLASGFGDLPRLKVEAIGYGAGTIDLPIPNLLRVFIGEAEIPAERDAVLLIETNIDDLAPKLYQKAIARVMRAGALDAYITPILMKKKRQAVLLSVLTEPEKKAIILEEIFDQTTTLGCRIFLVNREKLTRKFIKFKTKYGKATVKLGYLGDKLKVVAPEYENVKKISEKNHLPMEKAYKEIIKFIPTIQPSPPST